MKRAPKRRRRNWGTLCYARRQFGGKAVAEDKLVFAMMNIETALTILLPITHTNSL